MQALHRGSTLQHRASAPAGYSQRKQRRWAHRGERRRTGRLRAPGSADASEVAQRLRLARHPHCTGTAESVCRGLLLLHPHPCLLGFLCRSRQVLLGPQPSVCRGQASSGDRRLHGHYCQKRICVWMENESEEMKQSQCRCQSVRKTCNKRRYINTFIECWQQPCIAKQSLFFSLDAYVKKRYVYLFCLQPLLLQLLKIMVLDALFSQISYLYKCLWILLIPIAAWPLCKHCGKQSILICIHKVKPSLAICGWALLCQSCWNRSQTKCHCASDARIEPDLWEWCASRRCHSARLRCCCSWAPVLSGLPLDWSPSPASVTVARWQKWSARKPMGSSERASTIFRMAPRSSSPTPACARKSLSLSHLVAFASRIPGGEAPDRRFSLSAIVADVWYLSNGERK